MRQLKKWVLHNFSKLKSITMQQRHVTWQNIVGHYHVYLFGAIPPHTISLTGDFEWHKFRYFYAYSLLSVDTKLYVSDIHRCITHFVSHSRLTNKFSFEIRQQIVLNIFHSQTYKIGSISKFHKRKPYHLLGYKFEEIMNKQNLIIAFDIFISEAQDESF